MEQTREITPIRSRGELDTSPKGIIVELNDINAVANGQGYDSVFYLGKKESPSPKYVFLEDIGGSCKVIIVDRTGLFPQEEGTLESMHAYTNYKYSRNSLRELLDKRPEELVGEDM